MSNTDEPTPTPRKRATSLDPAAEHELEFRESEGVPIAPQSAPLQRAWHRRSTDPPATPEERLCFPVATEPTSRIAQHALDVRSPDDGTIMPIARDERVNAPATGA